MNKVRIINLIRKYNKRPRDLPFDKAGFRYLKRDRPIWSLNQDASHAGILREEDDLCVERNSRAEKRANAQRFVSRRFLLNRSMRGGQCIG